MTIAGTTGTSRGARSLSLSLGSGTSISVDTLPPYQAVYTWERTA
jgi:hypothetical protein